MKPENVLIGKDGYIKITDFGLSKQNIKDNKSAMSFCGTPEYLAPEIVDGLGHGKAVDWWSLGAILFEMMTGCPPFKNKDRKKLYKNIKDVNVKFPTYLSKEAVNLIKELFTVDPEKRLGSSDINKLKGHVFFKNVDWTAIYKKEIKPPFIPRLSNDLDTKYIDTEFTSMTPEDSYNPSDKLEESDNYKGK